MVAAASRLSSMMSARLRMRGPTMVGGSSVCAAAFDSGRRTTN
jgi:hypothetical protein